MKKIIVLIALALILPIACATITDEPNSVSCEINEVVLSNNGQDASVIREDITQIDVDKYWNVWCYVQDSQNFGVTGATVTLLVDGLSFDSDTTVGGWTKFPVIRSLPATPAFYSTTTPGQGTHLLEFNSATKDYQQIFTVGEPGLIGQDIYLYAIVGVLVVIVFLVYKATKKKPRRRRR